jgi:hypothetical protein
MGCRILRLVCCAAVLTTIGANAQELCLPLGSVKRLASPDGSEILYGVAYQKGRNDGPRLWIENRRTHRRVKLFEIGSTLCAAWSPDGSAFYVNDHWASDRERAYIYDAATLKRTDMAALIQAADPRSRRFTAGHAYYEIERWVGSQHVAARFSGHTDVPPVTMFEFRYAVSRDGAVEKAGERISRR